MIHFVLLIASISFAGPVTPKMIDVPGGEYRPFFIANPKRLLGEERKLVSVSAFHLDRQPITNREFLRFVRRHRDWRRSSVARVFADDHYLAAWKGDLNLGRARPDAPVTSISWFAAQAYCEERGLSLPTVDQWEYALHDQGRELNKIQQRILAWYSRPNPSTFDAVGKQKPNGFGIQDLEGLIWEWVLDFNGFMVGGEGGNDQPFCGAGAASASDPADYAAFMRYSFRFSLSGFFTTSNLGFRCASAS
jgi:sulfatase modifying factor 1